MKKTFIILIALFIGLAVNAQEIRTVKGIILDSLTREGEPAAILQFFKVGDDEKPVAFTTTDVDGRFSHTFNVKGEYYMLFNNMGRKQVRRDFKINGEEVIDLGEILVEDAAELLKAGTVTAMRPLVKMEVDKMTYNVEDDVDSKTSTLLDMLRKVPMVSVDGQDNISVNGSSSFVVYVDGKPNQMMSQNASQIFKMMPASSVKNIEVVTNPGVRYDAEGVGGVLNITTNKAVTGGQSAADGMYGTVRAQASTRGYGGGLFGSMQQGKFALTANVNGMQQGSKGTVMDMTRVQDNGFSTSTHTESNMSMPMLMGNISASYEIDAQNLVSATVGLMHFGTNNTSGTTNTMLFAPGTDAFTYTGTTESIMTRNNLSIGADYQHTWADFPGRTFTLSYQYNGAPSVNNTLNTFNADSIPGFDLTDRKSDGRTGSTDHTVQADFTTPMGMYYSLSTGAKYIDRHNSSDQQDYLWDGTKFVVNPLSSLNYDFYNRIGAAYAELTGNFGTIGIKGGVRYEHTWQSYTHRQLRHHRHQGRRPLRAHLAVLQLLRADGRVQHQLRQPGPDRQHPVEPVDDAEHRHQLQHAHLPPGYLLPEPLRGHHRSDRPYLRQHRTGSRARPQRLPRVQRLYSEGDGQCHIMINGGLTYSDISSAQLNQSNSGWAYNLMVGGQQTLPWDIRLSANAIMMGSQVTLQGRTTGMSMAMVGLTKSFLNDRLSFSVNGMLPLAKGFEMSMSSHTVGNGFVSDMSTTIPMRQITFQVSWTFGKQGNYSAKRASRTIQNEDQLNSTTTAESMGSIMMQ